jgi:hypothetical protein
MKVLFDIQDMLEDELKKISKKEDITAMDLENIYKMVDIVKDITTVDAMHKAEQEGYSRDYARDYSRGYSEDYANAYGSYRSYDGRRGRDGDGDGRYSEDSSYRRGRDSLGRYVSRDGSYRGGSYEGGYSGHDKEDMIDHLKEMMRNARSDEERESYRKTIEQLQR